VSAGRFDPNAAAAAGSGIFGLPGTEPESALVLLPVPWEATTSYGGGTSDGPSAILEASKQVDLFDSDVLRPYEAGIFLLPESSDVRQWNEEARRAAEPVIAAGGDVDGRPELQKALHRVNLLGGQVNQFVHRETRRLLKAGKIAGVVGGDHSVPFGALQAATEAFGEVGILHFDAHSDTRNAYEGFTWSHASIMRNVLDEIPAVKKLVQIGIRDFCEDEVEYCLAQGERVRTFFDADLARQRFEGVNWASLTEQMIAPLPERVWVSFDVDGLDPRFCPHTGTPVPGGLDFNEANYVLRRLVKSGRKIVGFDLNEVAPGEDDEWDANVGARLLYKLCAWTLASQGKAQVRN
jgi:agmatinase